MGIENPDADVAEQQIGVLDDDETATDLTAITDFPAEADPADVVEQRTAVPDEDDYNR